MNDDAPDAAVIIPTCNRRDILTRALEGVAGQKNTRFELIVVDDGSTDGTPELLEEFARTHPERRVRLLTNDSQLGANASRNRGIQSTDAPIVCFLDSDAIAEPEWVDEITRPFDDPSVGAVTGLVLDPPAKNIYDRTFRGTHRVPEGDAIRLVGTNMAVRRELLLTLGFDEDRAGPNVQPDGTPDPTVSGRGDEEGLYLLLKDAGHRVVCTHAARVLHVHHYSRRSFFKQALKGGRSAARLVYKFRLPPRLDMAPFMLAYACVPLIFFDARLLIVPLTFFALAIAAIVYNDLVRKSKTPLEVLLTFPVLIAYYHVRLVGYVSETLRLLLTGRTSEGVRLNRVDRRYIHAEPKQ